MSGNSRSSCLHTAPIVNDFWLLRSTSGDSRRSWIPPPAAPLPVPSRMSTSADIRSPEIRQLVLADLQLVAVRQLVRLDPAAVHVRPVQRPEVVDVEAVAAPDEQRVVARHRDVVEEHLGLGTAADAHLVADHLEGLARAPASRTDDQGALLRDRLRVERLDVAGVVELPRGGGVVGLRLDVPEKCAALLAVVRPLAVDEPAFGAVHVASPGICPERVYSPSLAPSGMALPARMSVSCWTSAPLLTASPCSRLRRSRLTSSARRMSILPCSIRRS